MQYRDRRLDGFFFPNELWGQVWGRNLNPFSRDRAGGNLSIRRPEQQRGPNYQVQGKDQIANMEGFALNELWNVDNDPAASFRSSLEQVGKDRDRQVIKARGLADQQANVAEGIFKRRTEGMGLTERQRAGARKSFSLNREVTKAAAATSTQRGINAQQRQADAALSGFEQVAFGQQMAGLTGLANAEGQRLVREAQDRASKKSAKYSKLGTLGSLALGALKLFSFSSEEYKDKIDEKPKLLDKLKEVRVDKWKYKGSKAEHIGPYAEEFNETFGVGQYKDAIDIVSLLGVTLGSIKELNEKVETALG